MSRSSSSRARLGLCQLRCNEVDVPGKPRSLHELKIGRNQPRRVLCTTQQQRKASQDAQAFFADLAPGSYVVHHQHGVARYGGMVTRRIGGIERDYLRLDYRGDDRLFVPSDQIDIVRG